MTMPFRYALTLLFVLPVMTAAAIAQNWRLLSPPDTPRPDLHAVAFHDRDTGFVAGVRGGVGRLYKTTNGGISWRTIALPGSPGSLNDLRITPPRSPYQTGCMVVAGEGGYVAVSYDRGTTWNPRSIPAAVWSLGSDVNSVMFSDPVTGFAVGAQRIGSGPRLARTTDGGVTWSNVTQTGAANNLYALDFFDSLNGLVVGTGNPPRSSATTDGGQSWQADATMPLRGAPVTSSLSFYDIDALQGSTTAYASGGKVFASPQYADVRRTTDMGRTWEPTSMSGPTTGYSRPASHLVTIGDRVLFVSARGGKAYHSTDAGASWVAEGLPPGVGSRDLRRMTYLDGNDIYLVGLGGIILHHRPLPLVTVSADSLQQRCTIGDRSMTLRVGNSGTGILHVEGCRISRQPTDTRVRFSIRAVPPTVLPAQIGTVDIAATVAPGTPIGTYTGELEIVSDDENTPRSTRRVPIQLCNSLTDLQVNLVNNDAGSLRVDPNLSQTLSLTNVITCNSGPVAIARVSLARGTDFTLISPTGLVSLSAGQNLTILLDFQPKAPCIRRDTVIIEHDATSPPSPIRIPIQGTGLVPSFSTRPFDTLDFGGVLVGQPRNDTLRLDNIQAGGCLDTTILDTLKIVGPQQSEFGSLVVIRKGRRIAPQSSLAIPMRAVPAAAGRRIAYAVILHEVSQTSPDTVVLMVNGLKPELSTVKDEVVFGPTDLAGQRDTTLVDFLQNLSNSPVTISDVRLLGTNPGDFRYVGPSTPFDVVVAPNPAFKRSIDLSFVPTAIGPREATLRLVTSVGDKDVSLRGNAERSSGALRFPQIIFTPSTPVNTCIDTTIQSMIINKGNVPLRITKAAIGPQAGSPGLDDTLAFSVVAPTIPPTLVIDPGDSAAVTVRFCPSHPGPFQARLLLFNNSSTDTFVVPLTGIGRASTVITVDSIVFRPTRVLTQLDSTLAAFISNRSGGPLRVDSMTITGADASSFSLVGPATPFTLASQRDTSITVRFNPLRRDRHFAFLNVYHTQGRQTVTLLGLATYPFLEIEPEDASSLRVRVGSTRRLRINIINAGDDSSRISQISLTGSSSFSNSSTATLPARLNPGETLAVSVDFSPDVICEHLVNVQVQGEGVSGIYRLADTTVRFNGIGTAALVRSRQSDFNFGPHPIGSTTDSVTTDFLGNVDFQQDVSRCLDSTAIDSMVIVGRDRTSFSILVPVDPLTSRAAPPGSFQPLSIRFQPIGAGLKEADLLVYFDGRIDSIRRIHLLGAASSLPIEYGPQRGTVEVNFGQLRLGWERDSSFTVTNVSIAAITLDELRLTDPGEFTILSPSPPVVLSPGVPVEVRVRFAPATAFGNRQSFVMLRSGVDADSSFRLLGDGIGSTFTVRPDTLDFGLHPVGSPQRRGVALVQLASPSIPLPLLDSVIIDRAEIVAGAPAFAVVSVPASVAAGEIDTLHIDFVPTGAGGRRSGIARLYFDRHQENGAPQLDSTDIVLSGDVDGLSFRIGIDLGPDIAASPGDVITVPIILTGDVAQGAFDSLRLVIGYRRTMLEPRSVRSAAAGTGALLVVPPDVPGTQGRLVLNLGTSSGPFPSGKVAELDMMVLLGDTLESAIRVDSAVIALRPEILIDRDSIRFSVDRFCDAQGRLLRFDSVLSITTTPNPATKIVRLSWHLPATVSVRLGIFDSRGNEVIHLAEGLQPSGNYEAQVDLSSLTSGTYICQLVAGRFTRTLTLRILE